TSLDLGQRAQLDLVAGVPDGREVRRRGRHLQTPKLRQARLAHAGRVGRVQSSRFASSGANAGRQIATYSAPSFVLYRIRSPARVTMACPAATSSTPPSCSICTLPRSTSVNSSNSGVWNGSVQPPGASMRAIDTADSPELTRPTYSSMSFPPGTGIWVGVPMREGICQAILSEMSGRRLGSVGLIVRA